MRRPEQEDKRCFRRQRGVGKGEISRSETTTRWKLTTRRPEEGWLLAAVGLAGKVLGPLGALWLVAQGTWPAKALVLCVTNDLIWWIPFGLYLVDARKRYVETWRQKQVGNAPVS